MWPRAEAHGNRNRGTRDRGFWPLQCGRGPKPTEIGMGAMAAGYEHMLQCGRGPKPTEMPRLSLPILADNEIR